MALLTLAEAKAQLNITTTTHDIEVQAYIDAAAEVVERYVGPVNSRTVTETHDVGYGAPVVVLRQTPALSLTSVLPVLTGGTTYDVTGLDLDGNTGVVRRTDGGRLSGPLRVTYTAGRAAVPPTVSLAARLLIQHLWRTKQGPGRPGLGGSDDYAVSEPVAGIGYAVPNRVLELLEPYRLPPGVA